MTSITLPKAAWRAALCSVALGLCVTGPVSAQSGAAAAPGAAPINDPNLIQLRCINMSRDGGTPNPRSGIRFKFDLSQRLFMEEEVNDGDVSKTPPPREIADDVVITDAQISFPNRDVGRGISQQVTIDRIAGKYRLVWTLTGAAIAENEGKDTIVKEADCKAEPWSGFDASGFTL
jgi:hypothetical protein